MRGLACSQLRESSSRGPAPLTLASLGRWASIAAPSAGELPRLVLRGYDAPPWVDRETHQLIGVQDKGLIQQRTAAAVGHLVERLCHSGQMAASELDALLVEIVNT